jgi:membrane-bound lytic murein transglycosylase B
MSPSEGAGPVSPHLGAFGASGLVQRLLGALAIACLAIPATPDEKPDAASFSQYIAGLWPAAQAKGVSRKTFDLATKGLYYDPKIAAHTEVQAEFSQSIWAYLAGAVIPARVEAGRKQYAAARDVLESARQTYGVDADAIMGVWGVETEFGAFFGNENVLNALATLGYIHYQGDLGRDELIAAMQIVEQGDVPPSGMRGSWAGAMGQPQFMPSSFLEYAVDFDGGGRRDIWTDKADTLGSIANFLEKHGWTRNLPWMVEVTLPSDYKFEPSDFSGDTKFPEFAKKGVRAEDSSALPKDGAARLFMPAGIHGPIMLITHNFDVIKTYNNSNAYVLAVGLLGDAIVGRGQLRTPWPKREHALTRVELKAVQTELKTRGFEIGEIDGRAGPKLEQAVRAFQFKQGLTPDGYASPALLAKLKAPS